MVALQSKHLPQWDCVPCMGKLDSRNLSKERNLLGSIYQEDLDACDE